MLARDNSSVTYGKLPHSLKLLALAAVLSTGCTQTPGLVNLKKPTISVHNASLKLQHEHVTLAPDAARHVADVESFGGASGFGYDITFNAQVPPVHVGGKLTEAADIAISADGKLAAIAYNTAGDAFDGAVQLVDIHDPTAPRILRQIDFPGMDINCVALDGNILYFGGGADPDVWTYRSSVGAIDVTNPTSSAIMNSLRGCRSYAATSIVATSSRLYVGVGARNGGVELFDKSLHGVGFVPQTDVRSLAQDASGVVALAGTTDATAQGASAQLMRVDDAAHSTTLTNFGSPYAKATLEIEPDNLSLLGLSSAGLSVRRGADEVFHLDNPSDDKTVATNGASADGNLIFAANGEYGFRVLEIQDRAGTGDAFARPVGHHTLSAAAGDPPASANFLRYKAGTLAVAAGSAGLALYHVAAAH